MPERETIRRARADKRAGKASTTQAGEFVREEMHHIREGKHGARSTKQAIAIGLSKARREAAGAQAREGDDEAQRAVRHASGAASQSSFDAPISRGVRRLEA